MLGDQVLMYPDFFWSLPGSRIQLRHVTDPLSKVVKTTFPFIILHQNVVFTTDMHQNFTVSTFDDAVHYNIKNVTGPTLITIITYCMQEELPITVVQSGE